VNGTSPNTIGAVALQAPNDIQDDDIVTISDCLDTAVYQVNPGGGVAPGNAANNFGGKTFSEGSHVSRTLVTRFYVANNPDGVPALYRRVNEQPAEELVEGVERMAVRFGVDNDMAFADPAATPPDCTIEDEGDGRVDAYLEPDGVADNTCQWSRVVGARVSVLLRSEADNLRDSAQQLFFDGQTRTMPNDGRMRHVVNATLAFRNKL
jgi:type IV pilus assembly protein PilW